MVKVRLRELLGERGMTYYRLSQLSGVSHPVLWRLLNGRTTSINFTTLGAICSALGCTPNDLLEVSRRPKVAAGRG